MNGAITLPVLIAFVIGIATPLLGFLGVTIASVIKDRREGLVAKDNKQVKVEEASSAVQIAVIADRTTWETRAIARMDALDTSLDQERQLRRSLEDLAHANDQRIGDLETELSKITKEKVLQTEQYERTISEQKRANESLRTELIAQSEKHTCEMSTIEESCGKLRASYDELKEKYDTIVQVCEELRKQLSNVRGDGLAAALGNIAGNIGIAEMPVSRGDTSSQ